MSSKNLSNTGTTYLRLNQVIARTGLSRSTIYNKMNDQLRAYDPQFPRQHKLGMSAVGWLESEVEAWLVSRLQTGVAKVIHEVQATQLKEVQTSPPRMPSEELRLVKDRKKERIDIVWTFLEKQAKQGERVFYGDVMTRIMLSPDVPADCEAIDQILAEISKASHAKNGVLLSALVHEEKTGKRRPKDTFFDLANSLGYTYDAPEIFVENQIIKLYELYEDPAAKGKGKLVWMRVRGRTFLVRRD